MKMERQTIGVSKLAGVGALGRIEGEWGAERGGRVGANKTRQQEEGCREYGVKAGVPSQANACCCQGRNRAPGRTKRTPVMAAATSLPKIWAQRGLQPSVICKC